MLTRTNPICNGSFEEPANKNILDKESCEKKIPFPKSIPLIISNEFSERFMMNGLRAIFVLYLSRELLYDDDTSTILYHLLSVFIYFFGIFGAIISDSWLGKYRTILYLSIAYAIGGLLLSLGAMPPLNLPSREITILAIVLIAVGGGGIKPCVIALGADQFKIPEQQRQLSIYFTIFYFGLNFGAFLSGLIIPIIRSDVRCFDQDNCFALAFGLPSILMLISIVVFVIGKSMYIIKPPSGNMVVLVSKCIGNAISEKIKSPKTISKTHWLDYAEENFDQQLINDIKALFRVLVLYIPLPIFWALFSQRGSRWVFQATRMNGNIGSIEINPDQIQIINPLLVLVFLPISDMILYPMLSKIGIRRPLQKLILGGVLAGIAFLISAIVELELEKTYPILPGTNESQLRFFNTHPCDYNFETDIPNHENFILKSMETFEEKHILVNNTKQFICKLSPSDSNHNSVDCPVLHSYFNLKSETAMSYFIQSNNIIEYVDNPGKSRTGDPLMRLVMNTHSQKDVIVKDCKGRVRFSGNTNSRELVELISSTYSIYIENDKIFEIKMDQGSFFTILITQKGPNTYSAESFEVVSANSMNILWIIPQYVILAFGEIMFAVTGLSFSYSQAPESMKAAVQACWLLTNCFGHIIAIIVFGVNLFDSQVNEFLFFAGLMFIDMCIFTVMAWRYKGVPQNIDERKTLQEQPSRDTKE